MHTIIFGLLPGDPERPNNLAERSSPKLRAIEFARSIRRGKFVYFLVLSIIIASFVLFIAQSSPWFLFINTWLFIQIHIPFLLWQPIAGWFPLLILTGCVLISVLVLVMSLPLAWYTNVAMPRRYGLYEDALRSWLRRVGRRLASIFLPLWFFAELLTLLLVVQPQTWWIWGGLAQFVYTLLLARFGANWLLPWLNTVTPLREGALVERLHVLLVRLHLPECKLYQASMHHRTSAANAYFIGWGNGRRILLTDTLIQHFTSDEIEVILAHELGHLVHHDIWTRIGMNSLISLSSLYLLYLDVTDNSWLNALFVSSPMLQALSSLFAILLFLILWVLCMNYRRYQEYQADEFALRITGNVQAFKTSMTRLTTMNRLEATEKRRFRLPASHPTLQQRLQHADAFALQQVKAMAQL